MVWTHELLCVRERSFRDVAERERERSFERERENARANACKGMLMLGLES